MNPFEQIRSLITEADLDKGELRIVEEQLIGRALDNKLVWETGILIKRIKQDRPPGYIKYDDHRLAANTDGTIQVEPSGLRFKESDVEMKYELAPHNGYIHDSDKVPQCPHCYQNNSVVCMGTVSLDGMEQPAYTCGNCSKVFSKLPNYVQSLADAAKDKGAKSFSFRPQERIDVGDAVGNQQIDNSPNYAETSTAENTRQMAENMRDMLYAIEKLTEQVKQVADKNNELMDKLSKDPLATVRKSILDFNLQ